MLKPWRDETPADIHPWTDKGLVHAGLRLFAELSRTAPAELLVATDLHDGNVRKSQRESVIDQKPFVGDLAYDATQHLFNCDKRLRADPDGTVCRMATLFAWITRAFGCGPLDGSSRAAQ
jgi:streptomycin 6-kinase